MTEIEEYFSNHYFILDREQILHLNELDNGPIHNVISLLEEFCYGYLVYKDEKPLKYSLFYIDNKKHLSGVLLELSLEIPQTKRIQYTIEFCKIINDKYPSADIIDSYNTFQKQLRTGFEKLGYTTIGDEVSSFESKSGIAYFPPTKGILTFFRIEKIALYRWLFDENENTISTDESRTKKIYLILDSKNNLIKIGQSFYPKTREKTLHGISPEWHLTTTWIAPVKVERELHNEFATKELEENGLN